MAARYVVDAARVLVIGAGTGNFRAQVEHRCQYTGADLQPVSPDILTLNLEVDPLPRGPWDVVVLLGVLEYIHDIHGTLTNIFAAADMVVLSYCCARAVDVRATRLARGWVSALEEQDLCARAAAAGLLLVHVDSINSTVDFDQKIFVFKREAQEEVEERQSAESTAVVDTVEFCETEFKRYFIESSELNELARTCSAGLEYEPPASVEKVLNIVRQRLIAVQPFSLIRVGDSEGNAYGMTLKIIHPVTYDAFRTRFTSQNSFPIELDESIALSRRVIAAIDNADMIGYRCFRFDENSVIRSNIDTGITYGALGIIYAREYLHRRLKAGHMADKHLTSAWLHLDLAPYLGDLLAMGSKVVVVTGRIALRAAFVEKLGDRLIDFVEVPVQGHVPESFEKSHYGGRFEQVCQRLSRDLSGCLVLIGAGLLGKIYSDIARNHGGVVLDVGSLFDALSGLVTRPVFSHYDFGPHRWV